MRVTLVNPPWQFYSPVKLYPLGISYLGAFLREEGRSQISLVDLNAEIQDPFHVLERSVELVASTAPDVLGLTSWTVHAPFVVEFVRRYKARHPNVVVVLGGIHASAAARELMSLCPADLVVHGEGEHTLSELLLALEQGSSLTTVPGISLRQGSQIVPTPKRQLTRDLGWLPFPAYDMLPPIEQYQPWNRRFVFSVMGSRGCLHRCAFCSGNRFWGYQRWRTPQSVVEEVRWLTSRFRVGFVRFEDDDLLRHKPWAEQLLALLGPVGVPFSCLARLDSVRDGMLELLAHAGCKEIYHGLESASPRLRKLLGKDMPEFIDAEWCKRLVARELSLGLTPTLSAMIGIPTETEEEMSATLELLAQLRSMGARVQLWILTPYPDTEMVEQWRERLVQVDRWRMFGQFDVFSEVTRDAYRGLVRKHRLMVPDCWMFANEAGVRRTGEVFAQARGRLMGAVDFV